MEVLRDCFAMVGIIGDLRGRSLGGRASRAPSGGRSNFVHVGGFRFMVLLFFVIFLSTKVAAFTLTFKSRGTMSIKANSEERFSGFCATCSALGAGCFRRISRSGLVGNTVGNVLRTLSSPCSSCVGRRRTGDFRRDVSSSFRKVKTRVRRRRNCVMVISPLGNSPTRGTKLGPGSGILSISKGDLRKVDSARTIVLVENRGNAGMRLSIRHPNSSRPVGVSVAHSAVPLRAICKRVLRSNVTGIRVAAFSRGASGRLIRALGSLRGRNVGKLVLSLHRGPKNLLSRTIRVSDLFIPSNRVLFRVRSHGKGERRIGSAGRRGPGVPLMIMVSGKDTDTSRVLTTTMRRSTSIPLINRGSFKGNAIRHTRSFSSKSGVGFAARG